MLTERAIFLLHLSIIVMSVPQHRAKRKVKDVQCLETHKYYRHPDEVKRDCATYYMCLGKEVFEYKCVGGLVFDIQQQICNFDTAVHNCEDMEVVTSPRPKLSTEEPLCPKDEISCANGICLHKLKYCDGYNDCGDGSDEGYCDIGEDPNSAEQCDIEQCKLPDCYCSIDGTLIPSNLEPSQVPQMLLLTFDDAVNFQNIEVYDNLFLANRTNPNGCPIRGTFYVSHEYTSYQNVERLFKTGHEIALHSISHRSPEQWWQNASIDDYTEEFIGERMIFNRFANLEPEDIHGMRVPFLRVGGNSQFEMMRENGILYDSSIPAPISDPPFWPYSLDYRMPHKCTSENRCPTRSHPGIWEMPMNELNVRGHACSMIDNCPPSGTEEEVYHVLHDNLMRAYKTNRAPMGFFFHTIWFDSDVHIKGLRRFLSDISTMTDIWIVTTYQALEWVRNPTPLSSINSFPPWQCTAEKNMEPACNLPNTCRLFSDEVQGERYMQTCRDCPARFPYLKNPLGQDV